MDHVRIGIYRLLGDADEVFRSGREGLPPLFRQQPGFIAYELVGTGDAVVSISHWQSREQAEAAASAAAEWVRDNIASLVALTDSYVGEVGMSSRTA